MRTYDELSEEFWDDEKLQDFDNVKSEDYDRYLNELNEIIENNDFNKDALSLKYFILNCQEKFEQSIEVCDLILSKYRDDIEVLNDKAFSLYFLKRYRESIEIYRHVLELDPENKDAMANWESAYLLANDDTLPKPPETSSQKITKAVIIFVIIVLIIYYLYYLLFLAG